MCGIALIVSRIRIDLSSLPPEFASSDSKDQQLLFSLVDLKAALQRRGPDSIGTECIYLRAKSGTALTETSILVSIKGEEPPKRDVLNSWQLNACTATYADYHSIDYGFFAGGLHGQLIFLGASLQLRGIHPIIQPLVDTSGNILVFNGEIFGGIHIGSDNNDAEVLMQSLRKCCTCSSDEHNNSASSCCKDGQNSVPELLSIIKGPWALIYWQESSKTVWFGRDAFGRRSLLVHWPNAMDYRLLLSSVSPSSSIQDSSDIGDEIGSSDLNFWEELSCGVYSISMRPSKMDEFLVGEVKRHKWTDPLVKELIKWDRTRVQPKPDEFNFSRENGHFEASNLNPPQAVLAALSESVRRRTALGTIRQIDALDCTDESSAPVAVLFSGGLDSMILAALLDHWLDSKYEIDLLNVSFDGQSAPDRISARSGIKELRRISLKRRWKLVEIDADLSKLMSETKHVMSLISPAKTYMKLLSNVQDLNIGIALWLAAVGNGWVEEMVIKNDNPECQRVKYESKSRILLVGSGADEQCAGYGRHKTKYRQGSWIGLHEEMKLDMQRIWKRNLGRDDRCIADSGKEARFPFLDEDVIRTLLGIPLWEIADLDQPSGFGDKKILREVARLLGLHEAAVLPKRAIQFGSRIARESNKNNFGSNRAANQASAGSALIHRSSIPG